MIHVVLVEPEIPPNTGNVARTCAAVGVPLHLVEPLGFSISDKHLRRAGLDYWDALDLHVHRDVTAFFDTVAGSGGGSRYAMLTTKGARWYTEIAPPPREEELYLLFGPETRGLSPDILARDEQDNYRIPMASGLRSLNLSNTVAIVLYDQLRRTGFEGLC